MLVMTRKVGEKIRINDDIEVTIIQVKGKQVRIAVKAPDSVKVNREELYQKIKEEEKDEKTRMGR